MPPFIFGQRITLLMDTSVISAMSAVLGSLVGGSATVATTWVTQRTRVSVTCFAAEIRRHETVTANSSASAQRVCLTRLTTN